MTCMLEAVSFQYLQWIFIFFDSVKLFQACQCSQTAIMTARREHGSVVAAEPQLTSLPQLHFGDEKVVRTWKRKTSVGFCCLFAWLFFVVVVCFLFFPSWMTKQDYDSIKMRWTPRNPHSTMVDSPGNNILPSIWNWGSQSASETLIC